MNKKQIAILGIAAFLMVSCTTNVAEGDVRHNAQSVNQTKPTPTLLEQVVKSEEQTDLDMREYAKKLAKEQNINALKNRVKDLDEYLGKTPYVFSGSTPSGWDCSGLVRWFYLELGIDLYHSATRQAQSGVRVSTPAIGDIVAFKHFGATRYFHVGIYIGNDTIIHARKPGTVTEMAKISDSWFDRSHVEFIRVIENQ
jgi:cell wall-associated NlpC family hydrolase